MRRDEKYMVSADSISVPGSQCYRVEDLTEHVRSGKPLLFLRFSDGEFIAMFNPEWKRSYNADGHRYFWDTLGKELRQVFYGAVEMSSNDESIRVWLADCWPEFVLLRDYILSLPSEKRTKLMHGNLWLEAVSSGAIFGLFDAIRERPEIKLLLSKEEDRPIAESLGAMLVPCRSQNVYLEIDSIIESVKRQTEGRSYLLLSSIGMVTECALWRLWTGAEMMIDFGHVPDAMMGRSIRKYLRRQGMAAKARANFLEWSRKE